MLNQLIWKMTKSNYLKTIFRNWKMTTSLMALLALMIVNANAQLVNVPVTGFNNDVVANGDGQVINGNTSGTGSMANMVTQPAIGIDGVGYTFIDATYKWYTAAALPTCYLPTGGAVPSALTSGLTYQLQSYSAFNARTITSNTYAGSVWPTTGSVSLVTPASYTNLYVLYETVQNTAGPTITATITFTDASTQVISGNTFVNWFTATGVAYTPTISRAQNVAPGTPGGCTAGTGPFLFQMTLPVSSANYAKLVQSISFNFSAAVGAAANTVDYLHIMAVGGLTPCVTPADQATGLTQGATTTSSIAGSFTAAASTPTGYLVVGYPTGASPITPVNGTTYTAGQTIGTGKVVQASASTSFSAAGLTGGTTYDVYVYSYNTGATCGGAIYNTSSVPMATWSTTACSGVAGGTYTVGPTGTYLSLTGASGALTAINAGITGWLSKFG
jgi:trimeric autotransporter adhesin